MKNLKIVVHTKDFGTIESAWSENISQEEYNSTLEFCQMANKGDMDFMTMEIDTLGQNKKIIPKLILVTSIIEVVVE